MRKKKVLIVMGSADDLPVMMEAQKILDEFGIAHDVVVASAHRSPKKARLLSEGAKKNGVSIIIAGAGFAAHLAGVLAAHTPLPVIGVPINSSALDGLDALLSTVQMPAGIPVATMAIGKAGAKNAGLLAAEILALSDNRLAKKLADYRKKMTTKVEEDDKKIRKGHL